MGVRGWLTAVQIVSEDRSVDEKKCRYGEIAGGGVLWRL